MKLLIGKIKNDCSEDLQELRGIKLVGFTMDDEDKKLHGIHPINLDDMEQRIKDEEEVENKANEEFLKEKKHKIEVWTSDGLKAIVAVTYKGFGIHNPLGVEDSFFKTITILEGGNKGLAIIPYCKTSKCKTLIDEIRETIGDKDVTNDDSDKLAEVVKRY